MMLHVPTTYQRIEGMGYAFRGLGDTCTDSEGNDYECGSSGNGGDTGQQFFSSAPDGGSIANCETYDKNSDCVLCGPGYTVDGTGGCMAALPTGGTGGSATCMANGGTWANNTCTAGPGGGGPVAGQQAYNNPTTCAAAGGNWNGVTCNGVGAGSTPGLPPTSSALTNFLNSLEQNTPTIIRAVTGQTVTQAQCLAAGGTLAANGTCSPGISSYMPLLLVAGVGIVLLSMLGGKGR